MPNERKCTQCGNNGHNSRTCTGCKKIKLFGVQINVPDGDARMRKCKSTGNLEAEDAIDEASGYMSDGVLHGRGHQRHERKKGKPWTGDEHRSFLAGLEKLGKGDWKGISTNFVPSRNSSQVASHAQKYFIRLAAQEKKHRRASVFDIPLNEENQQPQAGSTSASKSVENSQEGGNVAAPLMKTIGELKAQQDIRDPATTFVRPPLSPMITWQESELHYMRAYYAQCSMQGFVPTRLLQVPYPASYFPAPNFQTPVKKLQQGSSQASSTKYRNFFPSEIPPTFHFSKSPATDLQHGLSEAGSTSQAQNKNELNLNIGNLAL